MLAAGAAELVPLAVDVVDASREKARVSFANTAEHAEWLEEAVEEADLRLVGDGFDFASVEYVVTLCPAATAGGPTSAPWSSALWRMLREQLLAVRSMRGSAIVLVGRGADVIAVDGGVQAAEVN